MSFFGFDASAQGRSKGAAKTAAYDDFEEEDDKFNDETFGSAATTSMGGDFQFGVGQQSKSSLQPAAAPPQQQVSYAKAAVDEVLQPMASLWADEQPKTEEKDAVLSMDEIQAKLRADQPLMNMGQMPFPPQIMQALCSPHIQQQMMQAVAQGRFPNMEMATQAMIQLLMSQQMGFPPMMPPPMGYQGQIPGQMPMQQPQMQPQMQPPMQQQMPMQPPVQQAQSPLQAQPQTQTQAPVQAPVQVQAQVQSPVQSQAPVQVPAQVHAPVSPVSTASAQSPASASHHVDLKAMPSLAEAKSSLGAHVQQTKEASPEPDSRVHPSRRNFINNHQRQAAQQQMMQAQLEQMSPEERHKFLVRQQKVSKITRASGFMTPKDKDFVTRFQLSQIVTEDPYNEDFYSQVYKILNSAIDENDMNSLAQKYLDQSGHRLGGRSKRADIALQRMQQQVSKAVSVAKERGERAGVLSREGALGKVSVGSGKAPRRQLTINRDQDETQNLLPREYAFSKSSRSFQLSIIEKIYSEVLKLESAEREHLDFDSKDLWASLHLNDVIKTSNDEKINPFISILSVNKTMKLFSRMFHFITADEKFELVKLIFSNLQKMDIIFKGSYVNYDGQQPPKEVADKIELFEETIFKSLVYYLSELDFLPVLTITQLLVENNNPLIVCTTKIGLQLITVLVSRLELIKQEYASSLSAAELAQWNATYDSMFQNLEGRLETLFPPYLSCKNPERAADADDSYVWQFLASLTLAGQLNHQRIIVGEVRDEIFGVQALALKMKEEGNLEAYDNLLENLNLFLNVMGLCANETDISELE